MSVPPLLPLVVTSLAYNSGASNLLHNINFEINSNNITVVMGHNGAGKSLLVRLLHGLIEPSAGHIHWNGQSGAEPTVRLRQTMVFQKTVLLRRSAAANIDYVLKLRKIHSVERRNQILVSAGLIEQSLQAARSLSGGEQQRLAIARALACQPQVLFLDEPTASLDPTATAHVEQQIRQASTQSIKIIMITHDIAQARRLADDVIFMHGGAMTEHSTAALFFKQPVSSAGRNYLDAYLQPHHQQFTTS